MSATSNLIDDAPLTTFHKKLTFFASGGPFIDGYALSIIGIAFITMTPGLELSTGEIGLIGAASLIGIFFGGAIFGWLTDKIGRHKMYIADLIALALFSLLNGFATEVWHVVLCRFLLGMAIGADYPIATSLLAEFLPRKVRGRLLGATFVVWAVGAAAAFAVGYLLRDMGPDAWRFMVASPAIFAVVTLLCRLGTPESPRWLLSRGRQEEARAVIKKVYGEQYDISDISSDAEADAKKASFADIFKGQLWKRTLFVSIFWTAQVIPLFAVYTFAPDLLASFGLTGDANLYGGSFLISMLFVIGGVPGLWLVEKIGRRKLLLGSFGVIAVALAIPAFIPDVQAGPLFLALAIFAIASGASSFLEVVYPNELFPTEIRATAVGFGTAISRVGSAASTYLMPVAIISFGAAGSLLIGAVISLVGLVATFLLAPETANKTLSELTSDKKPAFPAERTKEGSSL
ncbi:MFS transporter [Arthrobacter crystallopoietes]|uniref:MFS transporter, putative metabolite transport protein n=1 Tax=Crystallibacter crystallopoietes TaxID=37928 RepID=A0A1H0ZQ00_9MICC|nr:MFS transporter [Arthrobacter crystallopoietes]AUI51874.1 MFS transporter [Arthrobacter crystallopoietes]SDQ29439.1 MFS transporter, putative metabolite transport protein [Arthrobacter crystallopoietes]